MRKHLQKTIRTLSLAFLSILPAAAAPVQLWAVFDQGPVGEFSPISIPLRAGSWRIGSVAGPMASNALIAAVLGNLTDVRLGGLGNAVRIPGGSEIQPFGFILTDPNLGGAAVEDFDPLDDFPWGFGTFNADEARGVDASNEKKGFEVLTFELGAENTINFVFSPLFLGDKSAAFGNDFTFRWNPRPKSGDGEEPVYVLAGGGRAILTGDVDTTVPEPATLLSAGVALALVALRLRR